MKLMILGGFLGSGKTTFLLQLARYLSGRTAGENRIIIVENEVGEVSIDDKILASQGYRIETMFSGCACCTIRGQVEFAIRDIIRDYNPEYILFEASGVACPASIRENLRERLGIDSRICTLVDAKRWPALAKGARPFLESQLQGADVVLVNKIDRITGDMLEQVKTSLREFGVTCRMLCLSAGSPIEPSVLAQILGEEESFL